MTTTKQTKPPGAIVKFNRVWYPSWSEARDKASGYMNTAKAGTIWSRVKIHPVLVGDEDPNQHLPFQLYCNKGCGQTRQLPKPAKWHSEHSCGHSAGAKYCVVASSSKLNSQPKQPTFMMNHDQISQFCTLFLSVPGS